MLYDDNALYIGVMCYDSEPGKIIRRLSRRDRLPEADRFAIYIDSYHDHLTAFVFAGTASGVQSDGILSQDGRIYDVQWDAVWQFAAQTVKDGWSGEFEIPFSMLRFNWEEEMVWGINFRRFIARKREMSEWVLVPRSVSGSISSMGHLSGLKSVNPPPRLEIIPYALSGAEFEAQPSPFRTRRDFKANTGFDLKLGLSQNFTLSAAINPDFGQVEVDQAVINLTAFETHYPEKRPFFLEGKEIFSFGSGFEERPLRLFYSRRIGQRPTLAFAPPADYAFVENPQSTTILGAVKLSGRSEGGLTVGGLAALTDREFATLKDIHGNRTDPIRIEPRGSYSVLRLRQEILENSAVGMMATSTFKEDWGPAYSGGIDWNLRFARSAYLVEGYFAGSQYVNSRGKQIHGSTGKIFIAKVGGEEWIGATGYDFASRKFWINDIGFFNKPRDHGGFTAIILKDDKTHGSVVRRYRGSFEGIYRWNFDGVETRSQFEFQPFIEFTNFWALTLTFLRDFPAYDDSYTGIIGLYRRPAVHTVLTNIMTDPRKPISAGIDGGYIRTSKGGWAAIGAVNLTLRPAASMEFTPGVRLIRSRNDEAWVIKPGRFNIGTQYDTSVTPSRFSLFGDRDYDEVDISLRGIITFTPKLSLQFFIQTLLDKGTYRNFRRLVTATHLEPYDYPGSPLYENPDFNEKTVNANLVLRWEYLPGSTFYLVWTHRRYGDGGTFNSGLGQNVADAFRLPADNVLLMKISYWWNL